MKTENSLPRKTLGRQIPTMVDYGMRDIDLHVRDPEAPIPLCEIRVVLNIEICEKMFLKYVHLPKLLVLRDRPMCRFSSKNICFELLRSITKCNCSIGDRQYFHRDSNSPERVQLCLFRAKLLPRLIMALSCCRNGTRTQNSRNSSTP